jgi:hypothetical protein
MKKLLLSLSVFFSVSAFSQASLSQSLVACYTLDGNANEPINALTGTLSAVTPTVNRFSQPNTAIHFNGSSTSFISLPNSLLLKPNAVSFSCWAKIDVGNTPQHIEYTTNGCSSFYEGYALALIPTTTNNFQFQVVKSTGACNQTALYGTSTNIAMNTWYHVGLYAGPDSLKLYVNGVLNGALANSNPLAYGSTTNVFLGCSGQSPYFPFTGSIDNARFYNRKLSGTEFNQLYTLDPVCQPQPVASFVATPSVGICAGQNISLVSASTNSPTSWSWTMPGAVPPTSSLPNPNISFPANGTYTVTLVASNAFGSSASYSQVLTVLLCSGINEQGRSENISIAPNPTAGEVFVSGLPLGTKMEIYNIIGNLIYSNVTESNKEKIDLSSQRSGMYLMKFNVNNRWVTTKLIKE